MVFITKNTSYKENKTIKPHKFFLLKRLLNQDFLVNIF